MSSGRWPGEGHSTSQEWEKKVKATNKGTRIAGFVTCVAQFLFCTCVILLGAFGPSTVRASEYLWGTVRNFAGQEYSVYVGSGGENPSGQLLQQSAQGKSIQWIRVVANDGTPVTSRAKAIEIVGIYQDYLWLKAYDYSRNANKPVQAGEWSSGGSMTVNPNNFFRFMLPYAVQQEKESNIVLNTVSGLGNASVRRRLWKEIFYYNFLHRPIHDFMDEVDTAQFGSPLYTGRYPYWTQLLRQGSQTLNDMAARVSEVSGIAAWLVEAKTSFVVADVTKLAESKIAMEDLQTLVGKVHESRSWDKRGKFLSGLQTSLSAVSVGTSIATDVLNGLMNHGAAERVADQRRDALAFFLQYANERHLLNDTEIVAVHEFRSTQQ